MTSQVLIAFALAAVSIESAVLGVGQVVSTRTFETADTIVVAALTKPVYSHKEYTDLKKEIVQAVRNSGCKKRILVTFDLDIYAKIKPDLTKKQKSDLISKVEKRQ